jgi:hypothetical protein
MANKYERPGTWIIKNSGGSKDSFRLDNDLFDIQGNSELSVDARISLTYDDTNISVFRTPPEPQAQVSNVGDVSSKSSGVSKIPYKVVK